MELAEYLFSNGVGEADLRDRGGKDAAMTQELVLGVLLAGLVGLIWAMTFSVLTDDVTTREDRRGKESAKPAGAGPIETQTKQRSVAA